MRSLSVYLTLNTLIPDDFGIDMVGTERNLIDELWTERPGLPNFPIFIHDIKYTGR